MSEPEAITGTGTGSVTETYVAALQHDLFDRTGETLVGVARRPTGWFRAAVDENHPDLGPPGGLLDEVHERARDHGRRGLSDERAHEAAWAATDFADRYREYLRESSAADEALSALVERVHDGEDLALVCYEGEDKPCHRHLLCAELESRL